MNKKLAGTGLAIGLVAGAGAGLILELAGNAGAASGTVAVSAVGDSTPDTTGPTDSTATTGTTDTSGGTTDATRPDPGTKLQEVLKPLVDDGTITQDQADKVIAAIVAARPADGPHRGPFGGHRGPGDLIGEGLDTVATTLGITTAEVRTALESGQTLADLAVSKGKTAQDVIDAIVADAKTHLDTAVTDGKITQAQADKLLTELTPRVTDLVNNGFPAIGPDLGGPGLGVGGLGGRGFGGHPFGDDDGDDGSGGTTATTAPSTTAGN